MIIAAALVVVSMTLQPSALEALAYDSPEPRATTNHNTPGDPPQQLFVHAAAAQPSATRRANERVGQSDPSATPDDHALTLIDATLSIEPNEDLRLTFDLSPTLAELLAEPEPEPAGAPLTEQSAPPDDDTSSSAPEADPVVPDVVVQITSHPALDPNSVVDRARVDGLIGNGVDAEPFRSPVDGVQIDDARRLLRTRGDQTTLTLEVPTRATRSAQDDLLLPAAGLHPIRALVVLVDPTTAEQQVVATYGTVIERLAAPLARPRELSVAWLAMVDSVTGTATNGSASASTSGSTGTPSGAQPDPPGPDAGVPGPRTAAPVAAQLDHFAAISAQLTAPVTVAVDPWRIDPADAERWQDDFVGDDFVAGTLWPLDPSSVAAASDNPDSDIRSRYARLLAAGEDTLAAIFPAAAVRRDAWVTDTAFSTGAAALARELGARLIVTERAVLEVSAKPSGVSRGATPVAALRTDQTADIDLGDGAFAEVLLTDERLPGLFSSLDSSAASTTDSTPQAWVVRTITRLLIDRDRAGTGPGQATARVGVLSGPNAPPDAAVDPALLMLFETWTTRTTSIRVVAVADLVGRTTTQSGPTGPATVELVDTAGPSLTARLEEIERTRDALMTTATMLLDDAVEQRWNTELDALIRTDIGDAESGAVIASLIAEAGSLRDSVHAPDPFTFTLTGRTGDLELRLRNSAEVPLRVMVRITSPKLRVEPVTDGGPTGDRIVTLPADGTRELIVPVEARANGTSEVAVELFTPSGEPLGERTELTSRVNALTGFAEVLTGGFLLVLLTWWFSHWRARRRNEAADVDHDDQADNAGAGQDDNAGAPIRRANVGETRPNDTDRTSAHEGDTTDGDTNAPDVDPEPRPLPPPRPGSVVQL